MIVNKKDDDHQSGVDEKDDSKIKTDVKVKKIVNPKVKSDQLKFTAGVFNVIFSTWLITAFPQCYWIWHCLKLTFLLIVRYFNFKKIKWQFFLLDFCYTVNYWSVLYYFISVLKSFEFFGVHHLRYFFNPKGPLIFRVFFSWAVGPLALSIPLFRNSLVFHSSDQLTILAVHWSPNLAVYGMRWFTRDVEKVFPTIFHISCHTKVSFFHELLHTASIKSLMWGEGSDCHASFQELVLWPILFYIGLWTIPYSLFFFVGGRWKSLEKDGYSTTYEFMQKQFPYNIILPKISNPILKTFVYMVVHGILVSLSFLLAPLLWHSFFLHTTYLLVILFIAVLNGGSYYFQVFAKRYIASLEDSKVN